MIFNVRKTLTTRGEKQIVRKIVFSSLLVCCCYFCISIGNTGHAEGLTTTRPLLVAAAKPAKSITVGGVEYVPKGGGKKELVSSKKEDKIGETPSSKLFKGGKNGKLENFEMKGKKAVGIEVSLVNLGIGPTAEYWFTDNVAVLAHYSGMMDFQTIGVRGEYLFDKPFKLFDYYNTKPYAGIGYSQVKYTAGGEFLEMEGSGVDFHAGILTSAQQVTKNLMMRLEVGYSTVELEMTTKDGIGGTTTQEVPGWSGFGIAYGVYYYF